MKINLMIVIAMLMMVVVFANTASTMGLSHSSPEFKMFPGAEKSFYFTTFNTDDQIERYSLEIIGDDLGITDVKERTFSVPANGKYSGIIDLQIPQDFREGRYQFKVIISTIIEEGRGAATVSTANIINFDIDVSESYGTDHVKIVSVDISNISVYSESVEICVESNTDKIDGFLKLKKDGENVYENSFYIEMESTTTCKDITVDFSGLDKVPYDLRIDVYGGSAWDSFEETVSLDIKYGDTGILADIVSQLGMDNILAVIVVVAVMIGIYLLRKKHKL